MPLGGGFWGLALSSLSGKFKSVITEKPIFGLRVKNLAIINIRQEFDTYLAMLSDEKFVRRIGNLGTPVDLPLITWRGLPMGLLTFVLQRSILGVESCVSAAVSYRLGARGLLTDEMTATLDDPVKLPGSGGGMANAFYNKLPAQVDPALRLEVMNPDLWVLVKRFYKEVRNPIFHGYELEGMNTAGTLAALKMLDAIYDWMDPWWGAFTTVKLEG